MGLRLRRVAVVVGVAVAVTAAGAVLIGAARRDGDHPITGPALGAATSAALAHTGGGTVTGTEVDDEDSKYEVEVTLADGRQVDVQLDEQFRVVSTTTDRAGRYAPEIDPAEFSAVVDNPWFPLSPGSRWVYAVTSSDGEQRITVDVLTAPSTVMGVPVVQVHDVVTARGTTVEDTIDVYSQRRDGSVWYFGEATTAYDAGVASAEGSWRAGVDGALPGIIMPADPTPSEHGYRQEYFAGHAEDMGRVTSTRGTADVPAGHFDGVVTTEDWSPLEPGIVEEKSYARGVGVVLETTTRGGDEVVRLVEHTAPG
jgi:hypothetical protein